MNRNFFGIWGAELSQEDFSWALAALGVVYGERFFLSEKSVENLKEENWSRLSDYIISIIEENRPLRWTLLREDFLLERVQDFLQTLCPANILARVWREIVLRYGETSDDSEYFPPDKKLIRFDVGFEGEPFSSSLEDIWWVIEQLSLRAVGSASVYVHNQDETSNIIWDYPLRIGLFDDSRSKILRSDIEGLKFFNQLLLGTHIRIVELKKTPDCDILLLPHDLRAAAATLLLESPKTLRCDCVIVTGAIDETDSRLFPLIEAIRTQARAAGVCLSPVPVSDIEDYHLDTRQVWFKELISQISHNQTLDVALLRASRHKSVNALPPRFSASFKLVQQSRITRRIEQFRKQILEENLKGIEIKLSDSEIESKVSEINERKRSKIFSLNEISKGLQNPEESFDWSHESNMATSFSNLKTGVEEMLQSVSHVPRKQRWIQTEIWQHRTGEEPRNAIEDQGLLMETVYSINVYIGSRNPNAVSADKTFNEEDLPPSKNGHNLTVFFTELNVSPEPQSAVIFLPPEGNSTRCGFYINIPETVRQISARIIIAYKNRVLQTALLRSPVYARGERKEKIAEDQRIELVVESVVNPGLENLTNRSWFDAAFIANHNQIGTPQMTVMVEKTIAHVGLEDIAETVKWFDDAISDVAERWERFENLDSKNTQELLKNCARKGRALYKGLMLGRNEGTLAAAQRIQIVTAKVGARLPLEFVYGRQAPEKNALLCEHAQKALLDGQCPADCPTGSEEKKVVCPLGFWGLNRVIERHAYDPETTIKSDFALQSDPVDGRTKLQILTSAVLALSQKVDGFEPLSSKKIIDALDSATNSQSKTVATWDEWKGEINARSPSMLVLLPHTLKDNGEKCLEISEKERLSFVDIEREHVLGPDGMPNPLVILMGCKTAASDIAYESFISEIRHLGAAIVVGTGSTILGRHAATVTSEFINTIAANSTKDVPFGDIMLMVRRKMLAQGLLMALCLTSYGDTDWTI